MVEPSLGFSVYECLVEDTLAAFLIVVTLKLDVFVTIHYIILRII